MTAKKRAPAPATEADDSLNATPAAEAAPAKPARAAKAPKAAKASAEVTEAPAGEDDAPAATGAKRGRKPKAAGAEPAAKKTDAKKADAKKADAKPALEAEEDFADIEAELEGEVEV